MLRIHNVWHEAVLLSFTSNFSCSMVVFILHRSFVCFTGDRNKNDMNVYVVSGNIFFSFFTDFLRVLHLGRLFLVLDPLYPWRKSLTYVQVKQNW